MAVVKAEKKVFKFPKKIGACADKLYELRNKRLKIKKEVDILEEEEKALKLHIINTLPKSEASGVAGKLARVSVGSKPVPQVVDWSKLYKHIKKTGEFDLLGRKASTAAVKERWEAGEEVPGVDHFNVVAVSMSKV